MSIDESVRYLRLMLGGMKYAVKYWADKDKEESDIEQTNVEAVETALDIMRNYQMMQADYNARLKDDMVAMLTEIQLEIEERYPKCDLCEYFVDYDYDENDISEYRSVGSITDITDLIQQKINSLKEKS